MTLLLSAVYMARLIPCMNLVSHIRSVHMHPMHIQSGVQESTNPESGAQQTVTDGIQSCGIMRSGTDLHMDFVQGGPLTITIVSA